MCESELEGARELIEEFEVRLRRGMGKGKGRATETARAEADGLPFDRYSWGIYDKRNHMHG
jgi:hypothetical protein